jgi:hypothetical protein
VRRALLAALVAGAVLATPAFAGPVMPDALYCVNIPAVFVRGRPLNDPQEACVPGP